MFLLLLPNVKWDKMFSATLETLYMTAIAGIFVFILGLIIGLVLFLTAPNQLLENKWINRVLSAFVNIFRSIPFVILIILLLNFTKFLVGTVLGLNAALPALIIGAAPFYGRLVEIALREIDKGVIEASIAMGQKIKEIQEIEAIQEIPEMAPAGMQPVKLQKIIDSTIFRYLWNASFIRVTDGWLWK